MPTGLVGSLTPPGLEIQRASNGTVVLARFEAGITERPTGSGNYVVSFAAPAEEGDYLLILDWNGGSPTPATSRVKELRVSATLPVTPSGLGAVADAAKSHMGETFDALAGATHYGTPFISLKVTAVKTRVMTDPPSAGDEDDLNVLVIDYLGKLVALELIPAAYDYWASQLQTQTTGTDPTETISYPDRIRALERLQEALLRQTRRDEPFIMPLLEAPRLKLAADFGPAIDEPFDCAHVTDDPRDFPRRQDFPFDRRSIVR